MNKYDAMLAWFAGFLDGEGSIQIKSKSKGSARWCVLRLSAYSTNRSVLEKIQEWWGVGIVSPQPAKNGHKQVWGWHVAGGQALPVLQEVLSHLLIKRKQARLAIAFQESRGNRGHLSVLQKRRDEKFKIAMHILNKRGI